MMLTKKNYLPESDSVEYIGDHIYKVRDCDIYITFDEAGMPLSVHTSLEEARKHLASYAEHL